MKILHTADWHLGQRFLDRDRRDEHRIILNKLLDLIQDQHIDILIIAGDIFDTSTPPNYAQQHYFNFLIRLQNSPCQHIIIIAGNHDSPAQLNAPKSLLAALNIHVIGALAYQNQQTNIADLILPLHDHNGDLLCVIAALPFLRDRDLRYAQLNESAADKRQQIQQQIQAHYQQAADLIKAYQQDKVPLIATGHLFTHGGQCSDSERSIHIGNLGDISAQIFDPIFDYVALGHLHKAQKITDTVHYSGSLLPMHFSPRIQQKSINIIDFSQQPPHISQQALPLPRALIKFSGTYTQVLKQIQAWQTPKGSLTTWAEAHIKFTPELLEQDLFQNSEPQTTATPHDHSSHLHQACKNKALDLLKITLESPKNQAQFPDNMPRLQDIEPEQVFQQCCIQKQYSPAQQALLLPLFQQLLEAEH